MKHFVLYCLCGFYLFCASCYYDTEEVLYPSLECQTEGITYSNTVLPILQDNCYVCHSAAVNSGNITLEGYEQVKKYVNNGQLFGAINHDNGYSPMPKNSPKMIECNIQKIKTWIDLGVLND